MDNTVVIDRMDEEVFNRGDLTVVDELVDERFVEHDPMPGMPPDREGLKALVRELHRAFPDFHNDVEDRIIEGDKVVERWLCTGTHEGDFMGIPATHRHIEVRGMDISRLEGGRIIEHWTQVDMMAMLQQLGVMPAEMQA